MRAKNIVITGVGSYVPERVLTNKDIREMRPKKIRLKDWTTDKWIRRRTGIRERRIAPADWASSDLMVRAARAALIDAGLTVEEIDLFIISTSFTDKGFDVPRTADIFKAKIGATRQDALPVFESATCAGFCWALARAKMEILNSEDAEDDYQTALVVSGDKITAATNYHDRNTCILFGDAAGAVVVKRVAENDYGVLVSIRGTDTSYIDCMEIAAGGSGLPASHETVNQDLHFMAIPGGNQMLKVFGGQVMPELCRQVCERAGIPLKRIRHIIPHQANGRIIELAKEKLGVRGVAIYNQGIRWFGNPSGSSIPLALDTLYRQGRLARGDYIILVGFGAGFTYGANLIRWSKPKFGKGE